MAFVLAYNKGNAQPSFEVGAAITGTAEVGQTLECTYTVVRAKTVTVRWYSYFDNVGTDQVLIGTGATYVLTGNEFGRYIRAIPTATNNAGSVQSVSSYTVAVTNEAPPEPPSVTSAAAISGTVEVGSTLTVAVTFSGADSVAYQWYSYTSAGGSGATELGTSSTQALTVAEDGKYIGCEATGTNSTGSTVSVAAVVGPVAADATSPPTVVSAAAISLDEGADGYNEGEYIVCDAEFSGWTGTPTFTWYKCSSSAKSDGEELVGAGEAAIRPLFVSEPNHWRGALFLSQSLGMYTGSKKYVYCVASATNSEGTTPSESAAVGPIGAIQGAQITQAMVGDGPYYPPLANTTYYLAEDISTKGSGIILTKANQKLNLNGKTLTFDNATPTGLVNGGFEEGDFTGWDVTNAPSASIYTVTDALADWNNARYNSGSYSCVFAADIHNAPRTPQYIQQTGITLEQGAWYSFSFMVKESPFGTVYTVDVFHGGDVYKSRTYTAAQWRGMRTVEVIFQAHHDVPTYDFRITITGSSTLVNLGPVYIDDVILARTRTAGVYMNSWNAFEEKATDAFYIVNPGSGYSDGTYTAVNTSLYSGESLASYPKATVTVEGGQVVSASVATVVTSHARDTQLTILNSLLGGSGSGLVLRYGLKFNKYAYPYAGVPYAMPLDHITRITTASGARTVKNGTITQGQDGGTFAYGIATDGYNVTTGVHRCVVTVSGHHGHALARVGTGDAFSIITDSKFTALAGVNTNRDYNYGGCVRAIAGTFARNEIYHSGGGGLYERSGATLPVLVYGNVFRNRMMCSNASCIGLSTSSTQIHDNLIDNTGDYYGRCMHLFGVGNDMAVYNNEIRMQPSLRNQEYTGTNAGGDQAVQFEKGPQLTGALDFYGNLIKCYAQDAITTAGDPVVAACIRWSSLHTPGTLRIRNNTLEAYATGQGYAFVWQIGASSSVVFDVRDNVSSSDSGWWSAESNLNSIAYREQITLLPLAADDRRLFVIDFAPAENKLPTGQHVDHDLVDIAADETDLATLIAQSVCTYPRYAGLFEPASSGGYRIKWTITIATGSEGAAVVIKGSGGNTVASGTSEANGNFVAELQQVYISGQTPTDTSSYTVTVNANSPVAFTADSVKTVSAPA